ncbi:hypothetical protein MJM28_29075, partial [Salmonella enterica subsp. enterica serovar Montevideo]|nr:hypothetical protein [Salmonella enterica subsp. enterica serovar Montevideo]
GFLQRFGNIQQAVTYGAVPIVDLFQRLNLLFYLILLPQLRKLGCIVLCERAGIYLWKNVGLKKPIMA